LTCEDAYGLWRVTQNPCKTPCFRRCESNARLRRRQSKSRPHPPAPRAAMPSKIELCNADEVTVGAALKVEKEGLSVAVFNVDGEFYVLDDLCTHGPGSLSEGYIEGDIVECNFHNGQFNIRTGEVVLPPCMIPMKTYPTTVVNGKVMIEV
jgi:biphenyl 2,3-dioxygenase ferredoxin component